MVFQLRSQTWFQDLMNLRILMFHCRKNSVRDKVIGKKWIYLHRNTLHRQSMGHCRGWVRQSRNVAWLVFMGWGLWHFIDLRCGRIIPTILEKGWSHHPLFGLLTVHWNCHDGLLIEDQGLVPSWTHLILISSCCILGLCYSLISCSLPPSFLFHPHCFVLFGPY